jgi:hypothetical protein
MNFAIAIGAPWGDFIDARTTNLHQGLPLGHVTIGPALAALDAHRCPAQ